MGENIIIISISARSRSVAPVKLGINLVSPYKENSVQVDMFILTVHSKNYQDNFKHTILSFTPLISPLDSLSFPIARIDGGRV